MEKLLASLRTAQSNLDSAQAVLDESREELNKLPEINLVAKQLAETKAKFESELESIKLELVKRLAEISRIIGVCKYSYSFPKPNIAVPHYHFILDGKTDRSGKIVGPQFHFEFPSSPGSSWLFAGYRRADDAGSGVYSLSLATLLKPRDHIVFMALAELVLQTLKDQEAQSRIAHSQISSIKKIVGEFHKYAKTLE
jgi:hypothetical protein